MTMQQVRVYLDPDEPDYPAAALALGTDALPQLAELAAGDDPMLASKAVYLAGLIGGDEAPRILSRAAEHADPVVRVAAAASLRNLADEAAADLGQQLIRDDDAGVRKVTARSVALLADRDLRARVRRAVEADPDEDIRSLADELDR